jgi:hypothetical protein
MRHLLRRRPSAAMVVAIAALVVAMSGSAIAASTLVGGNSLIKKNSLSGNRLQNHSVTGSKIDLSTLGTVPSATNATNATNAASASIAKVTYVASTATVQPPNPNATSPTPATPATATCPAGTTVIGGGATVSNEDDGLVNDSYPNGMTAWTADFFNNGGVSGTDVITGTVTAICAPAAATAP